MHNLCVGQDLQHSIATECSLAPAQGDIEHRKVNGCCLARLCGGGLEGLC
jgi:hypothetical protein